MDTKITPELNNALNELVLATGVSKASLVRAALAQYLTARGVLPPDHPDLIEPTPTRGPGLAYRTVEAIWLDACLARGFGYHFPQPEQHPADPEDG